MGGRKSFYQKQVKKCIKSIYQVIPTYVIGIFKLTKNLCHELESLAACFWWSNKKEEKACIGCHGANYENQKHWEVWVFKVFRISTKHYLVSVRNTYEYYIIFIVYMNIYVVFI